MKPNDFTMNTDFLSIAQIGKHNFSVVLPAGTVPAGGQNIQSYDLSIPKQKGAIDQMLIKRDSGNYMVGHAFSIYKNGAAIGILRADRTTASNLHVEIQINNLFSSSALSYPAMTFTIKVSVFIPPNVF